MISSAYGRLRILFFPFITLKFCYRDNVTIQCIASLFITNQGNTKKKWFSFVQFLLTIGTNCHCIGNF